jgi:hypothetical protein
MTEISITQYNTSLNNAEEGKIQDITVLVEKKEWCSDLSCFKLFITITFTSIMTPFIVCDIYFAMNDVSCVNQKTPEMDIVMRVYLLSSGLISLIMTGLIDIYILSTSNNLLTSNNEENQDGVYCLLYLFKYTFQIFNFSWLITGCVLFWAYMDINACAKPVYDYLMARFIIGIITTAGFNCAANNKKE